ncbi:hypothetical protein [Paenibacillus pabuli]|uniref:hypothetical protein n=1 Tax=Paenibacillus pabuli TaxID=1472 RepID=UPI000780F640|nr:hypothetical protein [Paenibacillus pabuli]MEC0129189.1 hypothetical protein [Paenibacillus pabuli]
MNLDFTFRSDHWQDYARGAWVTLDVSMIGIAEIIYTARAVQGVTFQPLAPLLVAAAIYFIITVTLANLLSWLERRLSTSR